MNQAAVGSEYSWLDAHLADSKKIQLTMEKTIQLQISESSFVGYESIWSQGNTAERKWIMLTAGQTGIWKIWS